MFLGQKCPECGVPTVFIGVEPSEFRNAWVEIYICPRHTTRFEAPILRNKHDRDYKDKPYEEES